jgi:hypothetical protein
MRKNEALDFCDIEARNNHHKRINLAKCAVFDPRGALFVIYQFFIMGPTVILPSKRYNVEYNKNSARY